MEAPSAYAPSPARHRRRAAPAAGDQPDVAGDGAGRAAQAPALEVSHSRVLLGASLFAVVFAG